MLSAAACTATLKHLLAATLAPGRGMSANELLSDLTAEDDLRDGPAGLDSIDQLTAARQVSEFFELEKTGLEELLLRRRQLCEWSELVQAALNSGLLTDLWFRSGGTSGEPKLVPQPISHLQAETQEIAGILPDTRRIIALVPLHHIYGFIWGPLLSDRLGIPLIHGPDAITASHHQLQAGDLIVAVPEWWQYFAGRRQRLPDGIRGVTSTAPCPPELIQKMLDNGLVSMMEVYGSSETAGIGWREDSKEGFQLFGHWRRHSEKELVPPDGRTLTLPDLVQWESDRTLRPLRRRDNAVQVGGVNVWPEKVKDFLETHPEIKACAVRPLETPHGLRLKAFIVPEKSLDEEGRVNIRHWLKTELPAAERPTHLTFGDALPRNEMGKLCDW